MHIVQRLVLLPHLGKAHSDASQRNSGVSSLVRICMHDPNLALAFFSRSARTLVHSQRLALRCIVPRKRRNRVRNSGTEGCWLHIGTSGVDLKCPAWKFVGKLITFRRLRFNCTSCEWAREMHRRRSNRTQPTALATLAGHKHFVCGSQTPVCIE